MYKDAGGGGERSLDYWVAVFDTPEERARIEASNVQFADLIKRGVSPADTVQSRAASQQAYGVESNNKARGIVSLRLAISMRGVDVALETCFPKSVKPVVVKAMTPKVVVPPVEVADPAAAAEAEKRTQDLLKRTENLVVAPQGKGTYPKTSLTVGTGYTVSNNREVIVDERDIFVRGEKFAFVLEYGRAIYTPVELTMVEDQTQQVVFRAFLSQHPGGTSSNSGVLRGTVDMANGHYRLIARGGSEILASATFAVQDRGLIRNR